MEKLEFYKNIEEIFKNEIKNGYQSKYKCDDFINKLNDLQNDKIYEENYQNGDFEYLFHNDYDYSIETVEDMMQYFKDQTINCIVYDNWNSIKNFMEDIEECEEYCFVNDGIGRIEKWSDSYKSWLENVVEQTQYKIKELNKNKNNER